MAKLQAELEQLRGGVSPGAKDQPAIAQQRSDQPTFEHYELFQELERERSKGRLLDQEKENLKRAIKMEQEARLDQRKDKMELEARLKTAEEEARKGEEERY